MSPAVVTKRFDNIEKSPNDKRQYRGLILSNELKVLLTSDPITNYSAAAMIVNVGLLSSPKEIPGLAHLCEHMLFLGTNKYPDVNDFKKYLSQSGGHSNACTSTNHTNYHFNVDPEKLKGALDRFSQLFISPLFNESRIEKEINNVHSEHEQNLLNDSRRIYQLDKSSADQNHPYSKFDSGNKQTLDIIPKEKNINVRQELINFYKTWYSANIMTLSVLGKESLDELEAMVVEMFSEIVNNNIEIPKWYEHPFKEEHFQNKWFIVPVNNIRELIMIFPLPFDLAQHYRALPSMYWSYLIEHEAKGSLLSALIKKGWGKSLIASTVSIARGINFFTIEIDLTEEGIKNVDDIIGMIFQYINMLKKEGPRKNIFQEIVDMSKIDFRFESKTSTLYHVIEMANGLRFYPFEEILTAGLLNFEWRPDLIKLFEDYLTPEKIRVKVISEVFESVADSTEYWFGTKFRKEKIPVEQIEKWKNAGINDDFHLPEKNDFLPSNFDLKPLDENIQKFPVIIKDTPFLRLWYKQDDEFRVPKTRMDFTFSSSLNTEPIYYIMCFVFSKLFKDEFREYSYNAYLAGLNYSLNTDMELYVAGYNDKMYNYLEKIFDGIINLEIDEKKFEIWKESHIRQIKNFETVEPDCQAISYLSGLLEEKCWLIDDLLQACSDLTLEKMRRFFPSFVSKMHIECLIHGNVTKAEALEVGKLLESKFINDNKNISPLLPNQMLLTRQVQLPNGCHYVYVAENKHNKISCTKVYYQVGVASTKSNMLLELFHLIASEPCFKMLRIEEQLGYIVSTRIYRMNGVQGYTITVSSDRNPKFVETRIDEFMDNMKDNLMTMTDEKFEDYKKSLATACLIKPLTLNGKSREFLYEIDRKQYHFDRNNIEVAYLRTINKDQLIEFYEDIFDKKSPRRRKLCIHVVSTTIKNFDNEAVVDAKEDEKFERINDILEFQVSHSLYPLPQPMNNIPRLGTLLRED